MAAQGRLLCMAAVAALAAMPPAFSDTLTPRMQADSGVLPEDIRCRDGTVLADRGGSMHACVYADTAVRLGWEIVEARPGAAGLAGADGGKAPDDGMNAKDAEPPAPSVSSDSIARQTDAAHVEPDYEYVSYEYLEGEFTQLFDKYDGFVVAPESSEAKNVKFRVLPNPNGYWLTSKDNKAFAEKITSVVGDRLTGEVKITDRKTTFYTDNGFVSISTIRPAYLLNTHIYDDVEKATEFARQFVDGMNLTTPEFSSNIKTRIGRDDVRISIYNLLSSSIRFTFYPLHEINAWGVNDGYDTRINFRSWSDNPHLTGAVADADEYVRNAKGYRNLDVNVVRAELDYLRAAKSVPGHVDPEREGIGFRAAQDIAYKVVEASKILNRPMSEGGMCELTYHDKQSHPGWLYSGHTWPKYSIFGGVPFYKIDVGFCPERIHKSADSSIIIYVDAWTGDFKFRTGEVILHQCPRGLDLC